MLTLAIRFSPKARDRKLARPLFYSSNLRTGVGDRLLGCRGTSRRRSSLREEHRGHGAGVVEPKIEVADARRAEHQVGSLAARDDTARPRISVESHRLNAAVADAL